MAFLSVSAATAARFAASGGAKCLACGEDRGARPERHELSECRFSGSQLCAKCLRFQLRADGTIKTVACAHCHAAWLPSSRLPKRYVPACVLRAGQGPPR